MNDRNQPVSGFFARQRFRLFTVAVALVACAASNLSVAQELRTWTSSTGVQAQAVFKEMVDSEVRLIGKDGKLVKFHLLKFSEPDQKYAKELNQYLNRKKRGEAVAPPVDPRKDATPIDPAAEQKKEKEREDAFDSALGEERAAKKPSNGEVPKEPLMTFIQRTWKSVKGKSVEGRLHSASGDKVYILDTANNRLLPAPMLSLSDKDRDYVMVQLRGLGRNDLLAALNLPKEEPPKPDVPPEQVAAAPAQAQPNPPVAAPPAQVPQNRFGGPAFPQNPQFGNHASQMHAQAQQRMAESHQRMAQIRAENQQRIAQMHANTQQRMQEMHQRHAQAFAPAPVAQIPEPQQLESPLAQMQAEQQQRLAEMQAERQQRMQESMNRMRSQQANTPPPRNPFRRTVSPTFGTPTSTPAAAPAGGTTIASNSAYETGAQVGRIVGIVFMVVVVVGFVAKLAQA